MRHPPVKDRHFPQFRCNHERPVKEGEIGVTLNPDYDILQSNDPDDKKTNNRFKQNKNAERSLI